jgi:hypothetical protein
VGFRGKLLGLLPLASAGGIFLLIGDKAPTGCELSYLLPTGVFGALVALGLFCYELRGIQECQASKRVREKA